VNGSEPHADSGGTFAYENWRAALSGSPGGDAFEYPLYSDARITGEITTGLGPYEVLNCVAEVERDPMRPPLVLRAEYRVHSSYADMSETDESRYHGGIDSDELAALLSLCMGIRLKPGNPTRWFKEGGDPRGSPWSFRQNGRPDPAVLRSSWGLTIPRICRNVALGEVSPQLFRFPELKGPDSVPLVRAALLYRDAVWVADAEPSLAWLLLVSAIEVAAARWYRGENSLRDHMREVMPELDARLVETGGDSLAEEVASKFGAGLKPTKRFISFCLEFLPPPPQERAPEVFQIKWSRSAMREALSLVYEYRSKALHAGIPFPSPMCLPPHGDPLAECIPGGAAGGLGGIWRREDLPMVLHTFEHIVRNALLAWWDSLLLDASAGFRDTTPGIIMRG
jgi:hypothetical protein